LSSGFAYQGEVSLHRAGHRRGESTASLSPLAFVDFLQNHDQIGNRPLGDRLVTQADEAAVSAALAVTLLAPMPPLLFMGEEWGSQQPFPFFCDFPEPLATAVRKGRRAEFKDAYAEMGELIPDPLAEKTFRLAQLGWTARAAPDGRRRLALVRELLSIRRREVVPHLPHTQFGSAQCEGTVLTAHWPLGNEAALVLLANLADVQADRPSHFQPGRAIWGGDPAGKLPAWSVFWSIGAV
jgi:maltooligosyltrehalose trehalohydrolase